MQKKNLASLFFLAMAVALWGLVSSERKSVKGGLAEKLVPTSFADVPGPESACGAESGSGSAESAESAEGSAAESAGGAESGGCEAESGSSCEGGESGCAVTDF